MTSFADLRQSLVAFAGALFLSALCVTAAVGPARAAEVSRVA